MSNAPLSNMSNKSIAGLYVRAIFYRSYLICYLPNVYLVQDNYNWKHTLYHVIFYCPIPKSVSYVHIPSNCKRLNVVDCNPEVFKNAGSRARYRDTSLQGVQKSLLKGLTAVALVFDKLAKTIREDEVVEQLSDGVALLANASHRLDVFRRQSFQGEFKDEYNSLCQTSYPVTGSLFGPSVQEKIKEVQESLKVARSTRRFQPFKQGTHGKRFPFLGQRKRWKQRGGGNMPQNNTQRNPWHQQKKGFQKRK
ncbi:hypothetical protein PoB_007638300 [Plakobranchus ocellatus]|uniref:Uncharacterized protein n=1 Tax=Plakobranchus ocellatus TaxID=259542 RepID=A0AAV4E018_9GAST|nr:hypothetical protein PoB_007638300 [Plakobranchus ocellatus]